MAQRLEQRYTAAVVSNAPLTPGMRRLVLRGAGRDGFGSTGVADEWMLLQVPSPTGPQPRWYTVRRFDAEADELTIDVVLHDAGPATAWAARARPGEEIVLSEPRGRYAPPADTTWELIAADQTALPAASRILEQMPAGRSAYALLEIPTEADTLRLESAADLNLHWVVNAHPERGNSPLAAATRTFAMPEGAGYVWMAGEGGCAREIRRYLRHELRWPADRYSVSAYWRPQAESYRRRYATVESEVAAMWSQVEGQQRDQEVVLDEIEAVLESHGL